MQLLPVFVRWVIELMVQVEQSVAELLLQVKQL
jgi:hypothetical protein